MRQRDEIIMCLFITCFVRRNIRSRARTSYRRRAMIIIIIIILIKSCCTVCTTAVYLLVYTIRLLDVWRGVRAPSHGTRNAFSPTFSPLWDALGHFTLHGGKTMVIIITIIIIRCTAKTHVPIRKNNFTCTRLLYVIIIRNDIKPRRNHGQTTCWW